MSAIFVWLILYFKTTGVELSKALNRKRRAAAGTTTAAAGTTAADDTRSTTLHRAT